MNPTTPDTSAAPQSDALPDYKIAAQELQALWDSLGLKAEITGAHAAIEPKQSADGRDWPHVAVVVTISRPFCIVNGREYPATSAAFDWRMGVGRADWKAILNRTHVSSDDYVRIKAMAGHGSLSSESQRAMAAKHLPAFVKTVKPAEVLARCCQEGREASGQSFQQWASDLGYDTDSRKALGIYEACQQAGDKARKLVDAATFERLADLSCRL